MKREAGGLGVFFFCPQRSKSSHAFFFAPHALACWRNFQSTWELECPSALPCFSRSQNLTQIVRSVHELCISLETG